MTLRGGAVPAGQAGAGAGPGAVRAGDDPVRSGARPGSPGAAHPRPAPAPPPALRRLSRPRGAPTPLSPPLGLSASPPARPHSRVRAGAASPGGIRPPRAALGHYRPPPGPPRGRGCGPPCSRHPIKLPWMCFLRLELGTGAGTPRGTQEGTGGTRGAPGGTLGSIKGDRGGSREGSERGTGSPGKGPRGTRGAQRAPGWNHRDIWGSWGGTGSTGRHLAVDQRDGGRDQRDTWRALRVPGGDGESSGRPGRGHGAIGGSRDGTKGTFGGWRVPPRAAARAANGAGRGEIGRAHV